MNSKNNKSPGLDGLPGEFYKCFWSDISALFYEVLICVFNRKEMSFSQRMAAISVIYKRMRKMI